MEKGKLRTTACALFTSSGGRTRMTNFRSRDWLSIPAASMVICAFVVLAPAQKQNVRIKGQQTHEPPPHWAYAVNPETSASDASAKPVDETPRHVPGSTAAFTLTQVHDFFNAPDWHPANHPAMPEVVAHGRKPDVIACGYCHLPNGLGRPENSSLTGLPVGYIVQQMADFKIGVRKSSEPRHLPVAIVFRPP